MKDLSNQKFEESWRKALAEGEIDPSPSVWSNIELDLMQVEGDSMKKKVIFYKWLAAASFFFCYSFWWGVLLHYPNRR